MGTKHHKVTKQSGSISSRAYEEYIERTGKCPDCGVPMGEHPICEACGVLCGINHEQKLVRHNYRNVCSSCYAFWNRMEERKGGKVEWKNFLSPTVK